MSAVSIHWGTAVRAYIRRDMNAFFSAVLAVALAVPLVGCSNDNDDIAARREAAREIARENRTRATDIEVVRNTALPARYSNAEVAEVEEVAAAIEDIPAQARALRAAKAVRAVEIRLAPEPIVIGPGARGDLQLDNTAPLETIRNAVEGSALAYSAVRSRGVVVADIVAARFEDETLTLYMAARD